VAAELGLTGGADELLAEVADAARTIAYACDVAWRRIDQVLAERGRPGLRRGAAERTPLADGVVAADGEAALALAADPARDPVLVLRAAAAAAAAGLPLAPAALRRLAESAAALPTPWPRAAREEFVRLLGAGPGLVPVWEALDRTTLPDGATLLTRLLPEWERTRSLPQRNALHIHTVDRHSVQTAVYAATRTRRVSRPDLLLVAAVCHDLGKVCTTSAASRSTTARRARTWSRILRRASGSTAPTPPCSPPWSATTCCSRSSRSTEIRTTRRRSTRC